MTDANNLIDLAATKPTYDELMGRAPPYTKADRDAVIAHMRAERAAYEIKERKREDRKAEREAA